jgi:hypothetical protein
MAKFADDSVVFSSGRSIYANRGIVGINDSLEVYEGYDGPIFSPVEEPEIDDLSIPSKLSPLLGAMTADDFRELADLMISTWQEFRKSLL